MRGSTSFDGDTVQAAVQPGAAEGDAARDAVANELRRMLAGHPARG